MPDQKPQPPQKNDKPKSKPKKPAFDFKLPKDIKIPKLTETQWAVVGCVVFGLIYFAYDFLTAPPAPMNTMSSTQQTQPLGQETEEERFKRENANVTLPDGSGLPKEVIEEKTRLTQQIPFGDKELEFRVRLPATWVMSEFARYGLPGQESYAVLTNIARYFGPAIEDVRPYMWVEVERMKRYMTAETWARAYMIKRGIAPQAVVAKSETDVQALYVDVRDLRSYAVRSRFHIEGDTMILISYGVPINAYKDSKEMMGLAVNSFALVRPINQQIEETKEVKLLNVVSFKHYASWLPKNQFVESTLRPSIELYNPQEANNPNGDLLQGLILVHAVRKTAQSTPEDDTKDLMDRLKRQRLTILPETAVTKELPLHDDVVVAKQTAYQALVDDKVSSERFDIIKSDVSKTRQEVWITLIDNGYYQVYVTLLTPLKSTNYVIWAQNMAAYELLLKTLTVRGKPDV